MRIGLILLFLSIVQCVFSQQPHDGLEFSRTEFNFPKTENWLSTVDSIEVTNTSTKKIFLLKQKYPREFEVRFAASGIEPGKTGILEIVFKPGQTGKFNASVPVFHTASPTPVIITYKGEVVNFDEFADVACPSFSKPNLRPHEFQMEVTVVDSVTKEPLAQSSIEIIRGEYYTQHRTGEDGTFRRRADIGYYLVLAEHAGYKSRTLAQNVNPKRRKIIVALPPEKNKTVPARDTFTVAVKKDTILPHAIFSSTNVSIPAETNFSPSEYKQNNIVFLIDKSSSMNKPDCMPLLQQAMTELAKMTRPEDNVTIITYANEAKVVMPGTPGSEHEKIIGVIQQLKCGGKTEGGKAIHAAYKNAEQNFIKGGVNQIIVATDGGFNGISENPEELMRLVGAKAKDDIKLSVLAFGQNRYGKVHIERLSKQGEGFYLFIGNEQDAHVKLTETIKERSRK